MIEGKKKPQKTHNHEISTHTEAKIRPPSSCTITQLCVVILHISTRRKHSELIWLIHFHGHISLLRVFWQSYGILYLNDLQIFADSLMTDNKIQNVSKIVRHTCQSISISLFLLVKQQEWQFKSGRWYLVDRDKISIAMFRLSFYLPTISKQQLFKRYH